MGSLSRSSPPPLLGTERTKEVEKEREVWGEEGGMTDVDTFLLRSRAH